MAVNREPISEEMQIPSDRPKPLRVFSRSRREAPAEKHEKNERIRSPASRKAESQVHLRCTGKAVQKHIRQSSEEKGYHW